MWNVRKDSELLQNLRVPRFYQSYSELYYKIPSVYHFTTPRASRGWKLREHLTHASDYDNPLPVMIRDHLYFRHHKPSLYSPYTVATSANTRVTTNTCNEKTKAGVNALTIAGRFARWNTSRRFERSFSLNCSIVRILAIGPASTYLHVGGVLMPIVGLTGSFIALAFLRGGPRPTPSVSPLVRPLVHETATFVPTPPRPTTHHHHHHVVTHHRDRHHLRKSPSPFRTDFYPFPLHGAGNLDIQASPRSRREIENSSRRGRRILAPLRDIRDNQTTGGWCGNTAATSLAGNARWFIGGDNHDVRGIFVRALVQEREREGAQVSRLRLLLQSCESYGNYRDGESRTLDRKRQARSAGPNQILRSLLQSGHARRWLSLISHSRPAGTWALTEGANHNYTRCFVNGTAGSNGRNLRSTLPACAPTVWMVVFDARNVARLRSRAHLIPRHSARYHRANKSSLTRDSVFFFSFFCRFPCYYQD